MHLNIGLGERWSVTTYHELFILYSVGFSPKTLIKDFGYSRSVAYRHYRMYRDARKRAIEIILHRNSVPLGGKHRVNNQGALKRKKRVPRREKPVYTDEEIEEIIKEIKREKSVKH